MSEYLGKHNARLEDLIAYSKSLLKGDPGLDLYTQYKSVIEGVSPGDVITIVDELVQSNADFDQIKRTVNKLLNIFYEPLKKYGKVNADRSSFIHYLMEENRAMELRMKDLKEISKKVFGQKDQHAALKEHRSAILALLTQLKEYEKHYLKIENVLFPYFEKAFTDFRCVNVMWSMHDDARRSLANLVLNIEREVPSLNEFNFEIGRYYFSVLPVIFREEYILIPECFKVLAEKDWISMLNQSCEIGFAFIQAPVIKDRETLKEEIDDQNSAIDLGTGNLEVERIIQLFNQLPVDITYVDENDEVRYFSNPKDRIFTRTNAIIGRKVQNCHPPESIETVNRIVDSFRKGIKDSETFWIQIKGKFIVIQYFAVRDITGNFKGTIEVSQDITELRQLEGERRILDV